MASSYKILGQSNPAATTMTDLYTVPASTQAVVSTLAISNIGTSSATIRVAIRQGGAALTNKQYILYDTIVSTNDATYLTLGMSLATTDVVSVYASTANVSFNLFGSEIV